MKPETQTTFLPTGKGTGFDPSHTQEGDKQALVANLLQEIEEDNQVFKTELQKERARKLAKTGNYSFYWQIRDELSG